MIKSCGSLEQQVKCSNITCAANADLHFTKAADNQCMSTAVKDRATGPNNHPYNDMVAPFVTMTLKGWLWYHGENNLFKHAGAVHLLSICSEAMLVVSLSVTSTTTISWRRN